MTGCQGRIYNQIISIKSNKFLQTKAKIYFAKIGRDKGGLWSGWCPPSEIHHSELVSHTEAEKKKNTVCFPFSVPECFGLVSVPLYGFWAVGLAGETMNEVKCTLLLNMFMFRPSGSMRWTCSTRATFPYESNRQVMDHNSSFWSCIEDS